jgi:acetyl-CoA/propionyl-CoA carboxylase, biotin carboxylase, biotin carboxyl carrier protein
MQYRVKIGDHVYPVEATPGDHSGETALTLDGQQRAVTVREVGSNRLHISTAGIAANLYVARTPDGAWIWIDGRARFVQDADAVPRRSLRGIDDTPCEVTPPTPATVSRILVALGEEIAKGQGCVVVSAMKMEITLTAPYSGVVKAVNTNVGAQVSPGDILVEIEPETEADQHG